MRTEQQKGWRLVPVEPTQEMMNACPASFSPSFAAIWPNICGDVYHAMLSAAPLLPEGAPSLLSTDVADNGRAPVASEEVERVREGLAVAEALACDVPLCVDAAEKLRVAWFALDAIAALSLTSPARAVSREEVEEAVHRVIVRWSNGEQPQSLRAMIADAILALIGGE